MRVTQIVQLAAGRAWWIRVFWSRELASTATEPAGPGGDQRSGQRLWLLVGVLVGLVTAALVGLWGPAMLDPDEHASVLYFERLIHGEQLEAPLLSTPKPLLTIVYGTLWSATHNWRTVSLVALIAFAVGVVALARAAARLAGTAAAVFTVVAIVGWGPWLVRVAWGNSIVWAFACWAVALDALTSSRRRWAVASVALLMATLTRSESWLLLPLVGIGGLVAWRRGERGAGWLALVFVGPMLWLGHDWLLSGSPFYSARVPERYTDIVSGRHPVGVRDFATTVLQRYRATPLLDALALFGIMGLVQRRALVWLAGLAFLGPGSLILLSVYANQGTYISFRYWDAPDLAIRLAAVLGVALLAGLMPIRFLRLVAPTVAGMVLLLALWPLAPWDAYRRAQISQGQLRAANAAGAIRVLRPVMRRMDLPIIAVPIAQQARVAVEFGVPLTQVRGIVQGVRTAPLDRVLIGTDALFYDASFDLPARLLVQRSAMTGARLGAVVVTPLLVDPVHGLYVLAVRPWKDP
jgi:hypothetical protein